MQYVKAFGNLVQTTCVDDLEVGLGELVAGAAEGGSVGCDTALSHAVTELHHRLCGVRSQARCNNGLQSTINLSSPIAHNPERTIIE